MWRKIMAKAETQNFTKENEVVELKSSLSSTKEIIETISAFANTVGGRIVVGVNDVGKIVGVTIGKGTIENLANQIAQNTDPKIHPKITAEKIDRKNIILIEVKESHDHLVLAFGRPYIRTGKSTAKMSKDEYESLVLEKHKERLYFDSRICEGATFKDIDKEKVNWFLLEGKEHGRINISDDNRLKDVLLKLKLVQGDGITNGAILLFGKNTSQFIQQSEVKCILLPTTDFKKPYESFQSYSGNLFEQAEKTVTFILENIKKSLSMGSGNITAEINYEVPKEAIREVVVNAIVHRNYSVPSIIQVRVYPDRIEIWNPGKLPLQLRIEDLKRPHPSIPNNPLIFKQFYRVGFVEDVGGGTIDVVELCKKSGLPDPEFKQEMGYFIVGIKRSKISDDVLEKSRLSERQIKLIRYLEKQGKVTRVEYENMFSVSPRTASRELEEMCKKTFIEKKGRGPSVYYTLAKSVS
jgi:ATP-dependent DNA helicase RecG